MSESPLSMLSVSPSPPPQQQSPSTTATLEATPRRETSAMSADAPSAMLKLRQFTSQLFSDTTPMQIFVLDNIAAFPVAKALLSSVSQKFEAACNTGDNIINLNVRRGALEVLVGWLLKRSVLEYRQPILAESWCLGHEWEIPEFQNAVMTMLVQQLQHFEVNPKALRTAYATKESTLLQKALVAQMAFQWSEPDVQSWEECGKKDDFPRSIIFFDDVIAAMQKVAQIGRDNIRGVVLAEYLVDLPGADI